MPILLNIDTTTEIATVSISKNETVLHFLSNNNKKDHASFLQPAIKELLKKSNLSFQDLDAVSVAAGPGSYTGIRVGMASAMGFSYALNIPLITVNTLEIMALSEIKSRDNISDDSVLYCPSIDARRMEVFTALYDKHLNEKMAPSAKIITTDFLKADLQNGKIIFFGSGSIKIKPLLANENAIFKNIQTHPVALVNLAKEKFEKEIFTKYINSKPLYIKDFNS